MERTIFVNTNEEEIEILNTNKCFEDCTQLSSVPSKLFSKFWKLLAEVYKPMVKEKGLDEAFEYVYDTRYNEGFKDGEQSVEWKYKELFDTYPWYVKLTLKISDNKPLIK